MNKYRIQKEKKEKLSQSDRTEVNQKLLGCLGFWWARFNICLFGLFGIFLRSSMDNDEFLYLFLPIILFVFLLLSYRINKYEKEINNFIDEKLDDDANGVETEEEKKK